MVHLIDASFFVFRAYYSVPPDMADRRGQPVNALYGFARFLSDLLERSAPVRIALAFDESLTSSFRNRIYPAYKANRELPPAELSRQFALCRELCHCLGVAEFGHREYEADDIIGTLATRVRALGFRSVLVTRDKDLSQLVREGDEFWDWVGEQRYGYADIAARFGVQPERMADYLALTGDSVDNIPGVPGVGPKTAAVLLTHFESLDHLYENLHRVPSLALRGAKSVAERLAKHRDAAYLARQLTHIACDMQLELGPGVLCRVAPDLAALGSLYDEAGFGPMLRRQAERISQALAA